MQMKARTASSFEAISAVLLEAEDIDHYDISIILAFNANLF